MLFNIFSKTHIECDFPIANVYSVVFMYSKASINWSIVEVHLCGPFTQVVDKQKFPKYRKDIVRLILLMRKGGRYREGVAL